MAKSAVRTRTGTVLPGYGKGYLTTPKALAFYHDDIVFSAEPAAHRVSKFRFF